MNTSPRRRPRLPLRNSTPSKARFLQQRAAAPAVLRCPCCGFPAPRAGLRGVDWLQRLPAELRAEVIDAFECAIRAGCAIPREVLAHASLHFGLNLTLHPADTRRRADVLAVLIALRAADAPALWRMPPRSSAKAGAARLERSAQ